MQASLIATRSQRCRKKFLKFFLQALKNSATIQGFADRSEAKLEENGLQGIFKKIQPISVGV